MIVTIDRGVDVEARIDDLVGWCASAECRRSWPGVDRVRAHGDALRYDVAVGVPGLPGATVSVDEQLGPVQTRGVLRRLGSDQLWTWPYGEVMAFCLTPDSRLTWPGTEAARSEGGVLCYDVDMRVPGIPPARLLVEERVGQPAKKGRVHTVETVHRWTWPGGEVSNCWLTYRFHRVRSSTQVDLTWRFVVPGAIDGQPIDRTRLDTAVGKAPERYLQALSGEPALAGAST